MNCPVGVSINQSSGLAGLAHWVNRYLGLSGQNAIGKKDECITKLKEWVDDQYANGRVTSISDNELEAAIKTLMPNLLKDNS